MSIFFVLKFSAILKGTTKGWNVMGNFTNVQPKYKFKLNSFRLTYTFRFLTLLYETIIFIRK